MNLGQPTGSDQQESASTRRCSVARWELKSRVALTCPCWQRMETCLWDPWRWQIRCRMKRLMKHWRIDHSHTIRLAFLLWLCEMGHLLYLVHVCWLHSEWIHHVLIFFYTGDRPLFTDPVLVEYIVVPCSMYQHFPGQEQVKFFQNVPNNVTSTFQLSTLWEYCENI